MKSIFILTFTALYIFASDAFISQEDLSDKISSNHNLVILDVTDKENYNSGHIPNAIRVDEGDFRKQVLMHKKIKSPEKIQDVIRSLGINNNSEVVIYGHGKKKEILKTSYIAMALITHGVKKVSLLDGGYNAWIFEYPKSISTKTPAVKKSDFVAKYNSNVLIELDYVQSKIGKVAMLDARPPRYYYGSLLSGGVERYGHIPNSVSSFWGDKFRNDKTIREDEDLEEMITKGFNLDKNDEVILYCTGGLETSMNWYILSQHMGFKNAKMYDGSMREWGNRDDTPLVRYKWELSPKQ